MNRVAGIAGIAVIAVIAVIAFWLQCDYNRLLLLLLLLLLLYHNIYIFLNNNLKSWIVCLYQTTNNHVRYFLLRSHL
jgi:prepilin signal peptidase PulO-like enzyme (type II secretory pathway)